MSCDRVSPSKEEVTNILIHRGLLFELRPDYTVEDILSNYKYLQDNMVLPEGDNAKYSIFDNIIEERFSNIAKEKYKDRIGKEALEKSMSYPDFIKKKDAGSRIHAILAELMEVKLGRKNIKDVQTNASKGLYAVTGKNFIELQKLVDEIYEDIQNLQNEIDPKGKVNILIEQRILDPIKNMGGTMDIHAVFSDATGIIYDYKTSHSNPQNYQNNELVDDLLHDNKVADNELTMAEYKRVAIQRMGVKKIRQTRLIPIHLRLGTLPLAQQSDFNYRTTNVELIEAGSRRGRSIDQFLLPIPVAGAETKYSGINQLLERQFSLLNNLTKKLEKTKLNIDEIDRINNKIKSLRKAIRSTLTKGEIYDVINSAFEVVEEIANRVPIPKFNGKDELNPLYLELHELNELLEEIKVYSNIIDNTSIYYRDLQESDPEQFEQLTDALSKIGTDVARALKDVKAELEKRALEHIAEDSKNTDGTLKPLPELDYFTRNFTRFSEIDHPIFKAAWKLIQDKLYEQRRALEKMSEEVDEKDKAVAVWAKANNMTKIQALSKIINFKTGHLIDYLKKELRDKIDSAYSNPDVEKGYKELTKYLEIADEEKYKEFFKERYKRYKTRMGYKYKDDVKHYKSAIDSWYKNNNLLESEAAWVNKRNRKYLSYKKEVKEANYSDEYKAIMNIKPLLDYYNMYVKYNKSFRDMLGLSQYNKLPTNFIPNIRKTMTESIVTDNISSVFKYIATEFWDSFNVREEDIYISDTDSSGDLKRTIPILFLNPLRNKNNEIDNTKKSYDLSKNLMLFAKMAHNYQAMSEIEPTILGMRELMAYPTSEQGGTQVLDSYGRKVIGNIQEYATKQGFDTDTYKVLEDITDYYLYGIKFKKENTLGNSVKLTKFLLKIKQYYAKKALSFAIIPGIGAYLAGNTASFFEGVKGIGYTKKNIVDAEKNKFTSFNKFKAISLFYDVYAEDPINRLADNKSFNFLTKISTTRNMFYPLRKVDELINDEILNRMALNWGIDIDNKLGLGKNALIRLNRPDLDTTDIKSIWELTSLDDKTGKVVIQGLTQDNYIEFRNAVKSTSANIIGSLSQEDISRIDVHLVYNLMFQFKSWMPGIIRERTGNLSYDEKLQAVRWGRYKAAFAEYGLTTSEMNDASKINGFISNILLPNIGKTILDITTFGLAYKTGLGNVSTIYTDPKTKRQLKLRSNPERAKLMYYDWLHRNNLTTDKVSFELFLETKEAQTRAMMVEIRTILSVLAVLMFLGADGDDDGEPRYMDNYLSRLAFKTLSKANSELTFLWSPEQVAQLVKNPVPMSAILGDVLKLLRNTFDEGRDVVFGENSPYDKAPIFFYTIQMMYGGNQVARFIELYETQKKNPY